MAVLSLSLGIHQDFWVKTLDSDCTMQTAHSNLQAPIQWPHTLAIIVRHRLYRADWQCCVWSCFHQLLMVARAWWSVYDPLYGPPYDRDIMSSPHEDTLFRRLHHRWCVSECLRRSPGDHYLHAARYVQMWVLSVSLHGLRWGLSQ